MSRSLFATVAIVAAFAACAFAETCTNPTTDVTYFTTGDATIVREIALIGEFTLDCADSSATGLGLFAEHEGRITPVARIGSNKYQLSWSEELATSSRGSRYVRLFDEQGFAALRKAQRSGADISSVPALATINVYHAGAFSGPWVNSEILAALLSCGIAYIALATKSKLLA